MNRFLTSALLGAVVLACAQPAPEASAPAAAAVDTAAVTAAASDVWTRWAAAGQAEDIPTLMGLITENYLLDEKGLAPLAGRPAAQALWESVFKDMDATAVAITPPEQTFVVSGERVHQAGTYVETLTTTGKPGASTVHGRFAAVVVKEADGQWRVAYIMAMTDSTVTTK